MVNQYVAINLTSFWHMRFGRQSHAHAQSFRNWNGTFCQPTLDSIARSVLWLTSVIMRSNVQSALASKTSHAIWFCAVCWVDGFNWPSSLHLLFSLLVIVREKWHGSRRVFDMNENGIESIAKLSGNIYSRMLLSSCWPILRTQMHPKTMKAFVCSFDCSRFSSAPPQSNEKLPKCHNTCREAMEMCPMPMSTHTHTHIAQDTFESLNR